MKEYPFPVESSSDSPTIRSIPFFQRVSSDDLVRLLGHTTVIEFEAGERIISEGELDHSLYFLLKGRVRIMKEGSSIASAWQIGEMFGETALLHKTARTATLVAESKVNCLKVNPDFVDDLTEQERANYMIALYRYVAINATERLVSTSEKLAHCERQVSELSKELSAMGGS